MMVTSRAVPILQETFDVPFDEDRGMSPYPWLLVAPHSDRDNLFAVRIVLRNSVRLIIDFEPQKFAAKFLKNLGRTGEAKRNAFRNALLLMLRRKASLSFAVNGKSIDIACPAWPPENEDWVDVRLHAEVVVPFEKFDNEV